MDSEIVMERTGEWFIYIGQTNLQFTTRLQPFQIGHFDPEGLFPDPYMQGQMRFDGYDFVEFPSQQEIPWNAQVPQGFYGYRGELPNYGNLNFGDDPVSRKGPFYFDFKSKGTVFICRFHFLFLFLFVLTWYVF